MRPPDRAKRGMVDQTVTSWNRVADWLKHIDGLQQAA
jgi:hypothetical protein